MKTTTHPALAAFAALALAIPATLLAQQSSGPDQTQNPRANDSTADQHAATTGAPGQGDTLNKNDSKNGPSETLDKNPSTMPTGSDQQATTKTPSDATTSSDKEAVTSASSTSGEEAKKPFSDKDFVLRAAQGGMTEVELGKLASEKGSTGQVKDFGARMVKDHSQANDELKALADKKGIPLPPKLDTRNQAQVDRLGKLTGAAFDKAYVNNQVKAHDSTIQLFRQEAQSGQDPDLKAFASRTLPTIEDHDSMIKGIESGKAK